MVDFSFCGPQTHAGFKINTYANIHQTVNLLLVSVEEQKGNAVFLWYFPTHNKWNVVLTHNNQEQKQSFR